MNKVRNFAMFVLIRRVLCQLWNKKSVSLTQYITQHQQTWLEKSARLFQNLKFLKRGLIGLGANYQTYYIILKQWRWAIYRVMKQETARVSYMYCVWEILHTTWTVKTHTTQVCIYLLILLRFQETRGLSQKTSHPQWYSSSIICQFLTSSQARQGIL